MAATCPPHRPPRLASETANSSASAPTAMLDFSFGGAHPDEFSIMCAERPDGLPRCVDECDAFPEGSSILDRNLQRKFSIGNLRDFRTVELLRKYSVAVLPDGLGSINGFCYMYSTHTDAC